MTPETFTAHRPRLIGLAYRMLGSVAAAEDVVQETWVRWTRAEGVHEPGAWATTVCMRLCLDELRSAYARREEHFGPWLPEPWVEEAPPPPGVLGESLSMAFLLLLEELSPKERAAFLLHDVFDEDYARVAEVLETSEANARQLVRRARVAVEADRPRFESDPVALGALMAAFGAACAEGDLAALERLLAEDVVAVGDGGGRAPAATRPVVGRNKVGRFLIGLWSKVKSLSLARYRSSARARRDTVVPARVVAQRASWPTDRILRTTRASRATANVTVSFTWVNGCPGVVVRLDGKPFSVSAIEVRDGRIVAWRSVVDPLKLGHLG